MALCLDFLIPLCCWCRNPIKTSWIRAILEDNPDLRPEVRNGMAMIVIYTLSAAKAKHLRSEMFLILQDAHSGLGIVNKTSLKIYNDPYNYFSFIKSSISGLIDAGCIPENERSNQPKKSKRHLENKEEVGAFMELKQILSHFIGRGDSQGCRVRIQNILAIWHHRSKVIRNRRFATALGLISTSQPQAVGVNLPTIINFPSTTTTAVAPLSHVPMTLVAPTDPVRMRLLQSNLQINVEDSQHDTTIDFVRSPSHEGDAKPTIPIRQPLKSSSESSSSNIVPSLPVDGSPNDISNSDPEPRPKKLARSFVYDLKLHGERLPRTSVPGIRFERVGQRHWELHEFAIFDVEAFLASLSQSNTTIYLLNEGSLTEIERSEKFCTSSLQGFVSLHSELRRRGGLLTSWHQADFAQLKALLLLFELQENNSLLSPSSLLTAVWKHASGLRPSSETMLSSAVLAHEIFVQVGLIFRVDKHEGWNLFLPRALFETKSSTTLLDFLRHSFPQLAGPLDSHPKGWVVKYCPHFIRIDSFSEIHPPSRLPVDHYRTLGDISLATASIFGQLDPTIGFHDFILLRS